MNRAERRAANKKKPGWQKLTKDQKIAALIKNGDPTHWVQFDDGEGER